MQAIDKIIAEAFEKIHGLRFAAPSYREEGIAIIKSACEKAVRMAEAKGSLMCDYCGSYLKSHAAHASEHGADDYVGMNAIVEKHGEECRMAVIEAYDLGKLQRPTHATAQILACPKCGWTLDTKDNGFAFCPNCKFDQHLPTHATASEFKHIMTMGEIAEAEQYASEQCGCEGYDKDGKAICTAQPFRKPDTASTPTAVASGSGKEWTMEDRSSESEGAYVCDASGRRLFWCGTPHEARKATDAHNACFKK